jgi:hypothetical protein
MAMDARRGRLYGITWPKGHFFRYDLATRELKDLGPISHDGEAGSGPGYRALCRAIVVNPEDGSVYLTTSDGAILRYRYDKDAIETVAGEDLRKDSSEPTITVRARGLTGGALWYAPGRPSTPCGELGLPVPLRRRPRSTYWNGSPPSLPNAAACSTSSTTVPRLALGRTAGPCAI